MGAPNRNARWSWLALTGSYAGLVGYLVVHDIGVSVYDDSWFFERFATMALDHGALAWNVDDGPVYGCTSQLYQLVAIAITAVTRTHFVVATRIFAALSLVGLGAAAIRWCGRATRHAGHGHAIAVLALGGPMVLATATTGMETALSLVLVAVVLGRMVAPRGDEPTDLSPAAAAGLTVLIYLCRPDAALLPFVAFAGAAGLRGELPRAYLLWLATMMAVVLGAAWAYYGTPLPLSFYMKSLALQTYGEHMTALSWLDKRKHVGLVLAMVVPLVVIVVGSGALRRRGPTLALFLAAMGHWAYHLVATQEIMGYLARFYVPGLVALMMAAARSWDDFAERLAGASGRRARRACALALVGWTIAIAVAYRAAWIPTHAGSVEQQVAWPAYAGVVGAGALVLLGATRLSAPSLPGVVFAALLAGLVGSKPPRAVHLPTDAEVLRRQAREVTTVRGVFDVARCLSPEDSVYHSEMGVTGMVLIDRRVVDLAGIVSREPGVDGRPFEALCREDHPAAIFLPHKNYRALNRAIRSSPCFGDYVRVVDRSSSPLYVRTDLSDAFLACATEVHRWRRQ